ncbi:uncharacterized protein PRCAT00001410001 [Priceomyces carsonii]|uniref:uncharacterized protein n=1 Tax=Priceomyces carsonii TaxID=28549 RepID=UPI002ED9989C|nr:unnamed protein product [Priceomyces carsonii]
MNDLNARDMNVDYIAPEVPSSYENQVNQLISELPLGTNYSYYNETVYGTVISSNNTYDSNGDLGKRCVWVGAVCQPQCNIAKVKEMRVYKRGN